MVDAARSLNMNLSATLDELIPKIEIK
ncbi:hypothetical protein GEA64_04890 [Photorhabdus khanii]|uniref:Uncharacterized protein n=1 Tax=Photorhabdus khanii TaxID=1004150 RepID=A0A7C9GLT9_9GAMM|nr:hypothetical protein [Photorhabdus khanii]